MIIYEIKDNKYYKNNKHVSKKSVVAELKKYQLEKLESSKICKVREAKEQTKVDESIEKANQTLRTQRDEEILTEQYKNTEVKFSKKDLKILEKERTNYRIDSHTYPKLGFKNELWRLNKRFGYYNFACYLDDLKQETIDKAIVADVKNQTELARAQRELTSRCDF